MNDPTDPPDAGTLRVPAAFLVEIHAIAASGHELARAIDRITAKLDEHILAEGPLIEAHHRRETAEAEARAKARAELVADAEAVRAREDLAKKQASARLWQIIAALATFAALALGTYLGTTQ